MSRAAAGVLLLALVLAVGWAGLRWGGPFVFEDRDPQEVPSAIGPTGTASPPTAELAEATVRKVDVLRASEDSTELALGAAEVGSVLWFSAPGMIPDGVSLPVLEFRADRVHASASVSRTAFAAVSEFERALGLLPDSFTVELEGSIMPSDPGGVALVVRRVRAAGLPLPMRAVPPILARLGREDRPDLPPNAIVLPLPHGLSSAYIDSDSLILVAARP